MAQNRGTRGCKLEKNYAQEADEGHEHQVWLRGHVKVVLERRETGKPENQRLSGKEHRGLGFFKIFQWQTQKERMERRDGQVIEALILRTGALSSLKTPQTCEADSVIHGLWMDKEKSRQENQYPGRDSCIA